MRSAARGMTVLLATVAFGRAISVEPAYAQIVPNPGDAGTIVTPVGNRFDISGGSLSGDNANLFHSLSQFGLTQSQIANFLSNPGTRNILVRVTGGNASQLDGLVQVSGSNANLFLMNPAGIVFGASATLNVAGSFTATTATGIGFGTSWFNASGTNSYETLVGNPASYAFTVPQPGSIINAGNLTVGVGQQLTLLGGTVVSSGGLLAPQGKIVVATVPGQSIVRLSQAGSVLSLEVQRPGPTDRVEPWTLPILSLPQLLTGGKAANATGLVVNAKGQIELTGSGVQISPGDVAVRQATAAPGSTLLRATGSVLGATAFLTPDTEGPGAANRMIAPPPDRLLPTSPATGVIPPPRFLPRPSVRQAPPPDSTLPPASVQQAPPPDSTLPAVIPQPSMTAPDCGSVCPTPAPVTPPPVLMPQRQPSQTSQTASSNQTLLTIDTATSSNPPTVTFPTSNQTPPVVTLSEPLPQYETVSGSTQRLNPLAPPEGDPEQNLSNGIIDDMNQASAIARQLESLKKYLQKRWKASPQLATQLQYRLLLDTNGAIQQIVPAGQEAATYLTDLKLVPAGKAVVRQAAQGLEVVVILSPDGTVDVRPNSLTLRSVR